MICPACGTNNHDENRFCGNCGIRLKAPATALADERVTERDGEDSAARNPDLSGPRDTTPHRTPTLLGLDLPVRQTHYPREGYEPQAEAPPVSSLHEELPPELIEYDKKIPLIAEPGTDRRRHYEPAQFKTPPPLNDTPEAPQQDFIRADSPRHVPPNEYSPVQSNSETTRTQPARTEPVRTEPVPAETEPEYVRTAPPRVTRSTYNPAATGILGLNAPTADEIGVTEADPTPAEADRMSSPEPPVAPQRQSIPRRNEFLDFGDPTPRDEQSLHGPSFLGLSSSPEDYEDDYEPVSHARRNFALFVLLLLAVLIALQWRSIRDIGMKYAQGGGIHIPGMKVKQPQNAAGSNTPSSNATTADANASNNTAVNGGTVATTNNGNGPDIEVAPTQNPNAASNSAPANNNAQQNPSGAATANNPQQPNNPQTNSASGNSNSTQPTPSSPGTPGDASSASGNTPAPSQDAAQQKTTPDSPKGTDVAANKNSAANGDDMPQGEPDTSSDSADATNAPATTRSRAKTPPASQPADDPSRLGATELAQANAASDPATAATWLWKATAKGNWEAPVRLADMYITGRGVPQDCDQAVVILRSASAKKNARARSKLGSLYATGQCVAQDRVAAYHWMSLALQANPGSEWIDHNRQTLWAQMNEEERRRAAPDRR